MENAGLSDLHLGFVYFSLELFTHPDVACLFLPVACLLNITIRDAVKLIW